MPRADARPADPATHPSPALGQVSSAQAVASELRARVVDGVLVPGERLSEERLGRSLGVSRNTLREAFRLLAHDRLVVHELNRGVYVRVLTGEDLSDLYALRRIFETAAVRQAVPDALGPLHAAVQAGEAAATEGRWSDVARADLDFHQQLVRLCASPRLDELMGTCMAELRLAFHRMPEASAFHRPYLERNRQLLGLLELGDTEAAVTELQDYLDDAERELLSVTDTFRP